MRNRTVWVVLVAAFLCAAVPARATQIEIGVTAALAHGSHQEREGRSTVPAVPFPLLTVRVPLKRFEIFAEGVPPIGPVPYQGVMPGVAQSTKLSYAQASLRYRLTTHWSAGIGETLYNQATTYAQTWVDHGFIVTSPPPTVTPETFTNDHVQIDASRVPGMRFEAIGRWRLPGGTSLEFEAGVTPVMHAIVRTSDVLTVTMTPKPPFGGFGPWRSTFASPETGSQVDGAVTLGRGFGPYTIIYGVRYLNYVAHFNRTGGLADRNTLLMPFVGFQRSLGH